MCSIRWTVSVTTDTSLGICTSVEKHGKAKAWPQVPKPLFLPPPGALLAMVLDQVLLPC